MSARKQDRSTTARLAKLSEAIPAARQRVRECELEHRRIAEDIAHLTDAVTDAYAGADDALAAKLSKQRTALEQSGLREAEERHEGAKRAVSRAEAERGVFAAEHADELVAERLPDALAAAEAVEDAVEALQQAQARWNTVAGDVSALLRLAGRDTRDVPRFPEPLATLVRDARRAGGVRVPPPVPGGLGLVPASSTAAIPASLPKLDPVQRPPRTREAA